MHTNAGSLRCLTALGVDFLLARFSKIRGMVGRVVGTKKRGELQFRVLGANQ